ncbi:hypothetical protein D9M71_808980 [compost metagenome]
MITAILTMSGDLTYDFCQLFVIGENRTAVAITPQRFAREEAGSGNSTQITRALAFVSGTKALCSIFDNRNTVLGSNSVDRIEVGTLTVQ